MDPVPSRVIGIYIDVTTGERLGDARISRVEAMPGGHIVMRPLTDSGSMAVIMSQLNLAELTAIIDAIHCRQRKIA